MKKRITLIFTLLLFAFVASGCTPSYKAVIDSEGSVKEEITLTIPNSTFKGESVKDVVEEQIDFYRRIDRYSAYKFDYKIGKNETIVKLSKSYKTTEEFSKSVFAANIFQNVLATNNEKYTSISSTGIYDKDYLFGPASEISEMNVTIELENEIIESNADLYSEKDNALTWMLEADSDFESVYVKYSNEKNLKIILKNWIENNIILFTFSVMLFSTALAIAIFILIKNVRNNRI